ncbi:MAG: DUF1015 family protein [Streptosporangiales bacterium]|nr:DUF1015 family protein [Streptosporangiales bacterium]
MPPAGCRRRATPCRADTTRRPRHPDRHRFPGNPTEVSSLDSFVWSSSFSEYGGAPPPSDRPPGDGAGGLRLRPFRGLRYDPAHVSDLASVTSPPYDVVGPAAMRRLMAADPHNVVRLILPQEDVAHPGERYHNAAHTLREWRGEGVLRPDPAPALYVYEERSSGPAGVVLQRGLIGALDLVPPGSPVVLPHEDVFPGPVADRLALMTATEANLEPILLLYEGEAEGRRAAATRIVDDVAATRPPLLSVDTADGTRYRLWAVTEPGTLASIDADLRLRTALIADGHHRYATYLELQRRHREAGDGPGPWDQGLALLVDSTVYPPRLGAIHRVLPGLRLDRTVETAKQVLRVTELGEDLGAAERALATAADLGPALLITDGTRIHLLTDPDPVALDRAMPAERSALWRRIPAAMLHRLLLPSLPLGATTGDPEDDVRLVHDDSSAAVALARETDGVAVLLPPMRTADVRALARDGERVPHKSTSFGPKPRTGLVLRPF